jgi:hypothetical protein
MTRRQILIAVALLLAVLVGLVLFVLPDWLWHPLGYCSGTRVQVRDCKGYNSWSGSFSDLGEITLIGGLIAVYRKYNCGAPKCWRIGKHPTADGLHSLCARHHPDLPADGHSLSLDEIWKRHRAAQAHHGFNSEAVAPHTPGSAPEPPH